MNIQVTANKLAEFTTTKPERRRQFVRALKQNSKPKGVYYQTFKKPAKAFLAGGSTDASIVHAVIERLKKRTDTPWKTVDSTVTTEALKGLLNLAARTRKLNVTFEAPKKMLRARLMFPGVEVNVTPALLVYGSRNRVPLIGAARFYLAKETIYQLGPRRAELVAAMQYLWLTTTDTDGRTPDSALCMVLECLQERLTIGVPDVAADLTLIERSAKEFVAVWNSIGEDAA